MKKITVRIICLITAFTFAVSFAACKSKSKDTDDKKADGTSAAKMTVSGDGKNTETPDVTGDSAASSAESTAQGSGNKTDSTASPSNGGTSGKTGSNTGAANNTGTGTAANNNTGNTGDTAIDESLNGEWI